MDKEMKKRVVSVILDLDKEIAFKSNVIALLVFIFIFMGLYKFFKARAQQ